MLRHEPQPSELEQIGGGGGKQSREGLVGKGALTSGIPRPDCGGQRVEGGLIYLGRKGAHTVGSVVHERRSLKLKAVFVWLLQRRNVGQGERRADA